MNKPFAPPLAPETPTYEADFAGWAQAQADHLRAGRVAELDVANIVEELESLGRQEYRELRSFIEIILLHMLKWDHQPERRSRSWANSIAEHRHRVRRQLKENPSLKPRISEAVDEAYQDARFVAARQTRLNRATFPEACPYSWDDIQTRDFEME
jgi:hypothetical protein